MKGHFSLIKEKKRRKEEYKKENMNRSNKCFGCTDLRPSPLSDCDAGVDDNRFGLVDLHLPIFQDQVFVGLAVEPF